MNIPEFQRMFHWCRRLYIAMYGPIEGPRLFDAITHAEAVALYRAAKGQPTPIIAPPAEA